MKIHIIGGSGSGKTYLAKALSAKYGIPRHDLDDLQWDNARGYGSKRPREERRQLLDEILKEPDWIIEGVYYTWCRQCFEDADRIYLLSVPRYKYRCRILRRFVRMNTPPEMVPLDRTNGAAKPLKWCMVTAAMVH